MGYAIRFLFCVCALWLAALVVPGLRVLGFGSGGALETALSFLLIAVIFCGANSAVVGPLLRRTLPLTVTALLLLALNCALLVLVAWLSSLLRFGLVVGTWWAALVAIALGVACWHAATLVRLRSRWSARRVSLVALAAVAAVALIVSLVPRSSATLIAEDGNFLFYNSPVAVPVGEGFAVAYLSSDGLVMLDFWASNKKESSYVVHDHADAILEDLGRADDHAAPALFYDAAHERLLLATAYHGTDLHLYAFSLADRTTEELSTWHGGYAYPRFVEVADQILLFARNQPPDRGGDLVARSSRDGFVDETVVVPAHDGFVVYAGTPASSGSTVYIAYSMHSYAENRMLGYEIVEYDPRGRAVVASCNLASFLDSGYFTNRPTGLGIDGQRVMTGTSFSNEPLLPEANYVHEETVLVLEGDVADCGSFRVVVQRDAVPVPYYNTGVAINDYGHYLFFAGDAVVTNWPHPDCFTQTRMLYPNFMGDDALFFASMNWMYSIRDFDNALFGCFPS